MDTRPFPRGIRRYITVIAALKITEFRLKEKIIVKFNRGTSVIGGVFTSYERQNK